MWTGVGSQTTSPRAFSTRRIPVGVLREIDVSTGQLKNPWCPPDLVRTEFYIAGTEPVQECTAHQPYTTPTDTGIGYPVPGGEGDTSGMRVTPGGVPVPRPTRPPRDTTNPFYIPPEQPAARPRPAPQPTPSQPSPFSDQRPTPTPAPSSPPPVPVPSPTPR